MLHNSTHGAQVYSVITCEDNVFLYSFSSIADADVGRAVAKHLIIYHLHKIILPITFGSNSILSLSESVPNQAARQTSSQNASDNHILRDYCPNTSDDNPPHPTTDLPIKSP